MTCVYIWKVHQRQIHCEFIPNNDLGNSKYNGIYSTLTTNK